MILMIFRPQNTSLGNTLGRLKNTQRDRLMIVFRWGTLEVITRFPRVTSTLVKKISC